MGAGAPLSARRRCLPPEDRAHSTALLGVPAGSRAYSEAVVSVCSHQ